VDVIHHITDLHAFFSEARRVLQTRGNLLLVTDSEETLRQRSLTRFFPQVMSVELARYPPIADLHRIAAECGLQLQGEEPAEGNVLLTDQFVRSLEAKCSSAVRLLAQSDFEAGMARVRVAQSRGETWRSCYVVLRYGTSGAGATA
jgi:cyclopropane fatty-acyl-phospholipid synthase-like methyltransferase